MIRRLFSRFAVAAALLCACAVAYADPINSYPPQFSATVNGLAPASGGGTTNYLRADGTWAVPAGSGGGTVTTTGSPASGNLSKFSGATSITNGDLSGDVTTSGSLATTVGNLSSVNNSSLTQAGQNLARTTHGDSNYTILTTDIAVVTNAAFTAPRTWTLPTASSFGNGKRLTVADENGGITSTNTLTIARNGTDTIEGASANQILAAAFQSLTLMSDGTSNWKIIAAKYAAGSPNIFIGQNPLATGGTELIGAFWCATTQGGASYSLASGDSGCTVMRTHSTAQTDTMGNISSNVLFGAGATFGICTTVAKDTITFTSPNTLDGLTSIVVGPGQCLYWGDPDGTNYHTKSASGALVAGTLVGNGSPNGFLYQDNSTNSLLQATASANNCIASDNGSGVPQCSTTIPGTPTINLTNGTNLSLTAGVTGVLPVANGGTNASSASVTALNNITGATGTPSSTTFLEGDMKWVAISGCAVSGGTQFQILAVNAAGTGCTPDTNATANGATISLGTQQTTQGSIVLDNTATGAFATTIKSSNSATAAWTLTLPTTAGSNGQVLSTDGAGTTSWVANGSGGSGCTISGSQFQIVTVNAAGTGCAPDANASANAGALALGASGTPGSIVLGNSTSGTATLQTVTGALGTVTASLPANTGTIAELNLAQTFTANQTVAARLTTQEVEETATALSGCNGSTATIDLSTGTYFSCTVSTGATTFAVSNAAASTKVSSFVLELTNAGSQTLTWMTGTKWPGGSAPTFTASGVDVVVCSTRDGATTWRCVGSEINSH